MANIIDKYEMWEGHTGSEVEQHIKSRLNELDNGLSNAITSVDTQLDGTSSSPVSNQAITAEINSIKDKTVSSMDVEENDDGETIKLSLLNKSNRTIASVNLPKGGGDGEMSLTKPRVTASVNSSQIKLGDNASLTWFYDHVNSEGVSDGVRGTIEITINRGTVQTYNNIIENVSAGTTSTLDITPYMLAGTMDIYVKATCVAIDGTVQTKQAYANIYVLALSLTSSFNISSSLTNGGYGDEVITVPFTVTGSGTKVISLYLDGEQALSETVSRSGTTNSTFSLNGSELSAGKHNIQLVAEKDGLYSESIFMDILKSGSAVPFIGIKAIFRDGRIYTESLVPSFDVAQYEDATFEYVVWTPNNVSSNMDIAVDDEVKQSVTVNRQVQTYVDKFDDEGTFAVSFTSGVTIYPFNVVVSAAAIDVEETSANLQLKLSAVGRSNDEANPSDWGGITTFKNCDFRSSGWTGNTLKLINGASADINYKLFETDATINGLTVETELMISNVMDKNAVIMSCFDNRMGFEITAEEAHFYTGSVRRQETAEVDDNDNPIIREIPVGVSMKFASELWLKIAFVLHTRSDNSLMELYINGVRSKADIYSAGDIFIHNPAKGITIDSTGADVQIRNIRIYNRALTDDEELNNYIVDRPNITDIVSLYENNDVIGENAEVSADSLRSKGKGVLIFVRPNALDDINAANDKKKDFLTDKVYWYSPYGSQYDFVAENINIRIQGTSSTKYPRKNYRLYLAKGEGHKLTVGGEEVSDYKYSMRPNAIAMNLFCLKADYSDSSMTMNTGGAKLFDYTMRQLNLLTPPQEFDSKVRQAIDGIPCDVFCTTVDGGELTYYGQYNFNNEKSKSGKLFGMEGVNGFTPQYPIALESLNNSNPCCLFQAPKTNIDTWLNTYFDAGFEFNYPEDVFWTQENATAGKGTVATSVQKAAIRRLMSWIASVTPGYADYNDISTFASQQFKSEASLYFDVDYLLTYYLITDYWGSVDQRAKNILWRTWDGLKWYPTFYDGDTAMGVRNDSFLAYLYNMTRDTWDYEAQKYAYEGHDSNLWCLVLANLEEELKAACDTLRGVLTTNKMLEMFNEEQQGNWCERIYNKSGEFKYIIPQIEGVQLDGHEEKVKYSYMYALTGNREAHRTYFLKERSALLDAKYGTSSYQADNIDLYINRTASEASNTIVIKSGDLYYYGYRTNNGGWLESPVEVDYGNSITLSFTSALAINDPVRLCGASKIMELDMRGISGHVLRQLGLNKCKMLRKIIFNTSLTDLANTNWYIDWSGCTQLEYVDLTGQTNATTNDGGTEINLSTQNKLKTLLLGDTGVTSVTFASGAPIEELVLPSTLTNLILHNLPALQMSGLTIQGYSNILRFSFSNCPKLDWQTLLEQCSNVQYIRVEGLKGTIHSSVLDRYKNYGGIDANGNIVEGCRFAGTIMLSDTLNDDALIELQSYYPELTIINAQYSHYWFDDLNIDPANITNEDNQTGPAYYDPEIQDVADQPNKYVRSGHIIRIHDNCKVVAGRISEVTGKMELTYLDKTDFTKTEGGESFDLTDRNIQGYDIFLLVPHYWYKGVNDYKNARKHFFLSSDLNMPTSSFENVNRSTLSITRYATGKAISNRLMAVGDIFNEDNLTNAPLYSVHRVRVDGMKQVRFPSVNHPNFGCVFLDADNTILAVYNLNMESSTQSPADFINEAGDYDFCSIPEEAQWLYFTCFTSVPQTLEVIVTDSEELEAIEPDWVEHKPELIGIYQGSIDGITGTGGTPGTNCIGLRSLSGTSISRGSNSGANPDWQYDTQGNPTNIPTSQFNMAAMDFLNFANVRGDGYSAISYETSKDMANLFMAWFGTRSVEDIVGLGGRANHQTGIRNSIAFGDTNKEDMSPASSNNDNQLNKIWGLEAWTGSTLEYVDNACLNAPSFSAFKRNLRNRDNSWPIDNILNIVQQDGDERRMLSQKLNGCVCRVRFGKYCDIIPSSSCTDETYSIGYANACGVGSPILLRSGHSARAESGVTFFDGVPRDHGSVSFGTRLCYFGDLD